MHAGTTSLAPANSTRGEWTQFATFLKRPVLPARAPLPRLASLAAVLRLFVLDVLVMAGLLATAGLIMAAGVDMPETALAGIELTPAIVMAVVIGAPLLEEIAFRGWLSGRPGHCLAVLLLAATAVILSSDATRSDAEVNVKAIGVASAVLVAAVASLFLLRRRDAMGWFYRFFPLFYWLSVVGFASVHLLNFDPSEMAMALPLVLPQFATGTILGYLRVNYGLWASVLLHALHNGAFIGLVLLAGSSA